MLTTTPPRIGRYQGANPAGYLHSLYKEGLRQGEDGFRYTFPTRYPKGSLGYENRTARQGYWVMCEADIAKLCQKHQGDRVDVEFGKKVIRVYL